MRVFSAPPYTRNRTGRHYNIMYPGQISNFRFLNKSLVWGQRMHWEEGVDMSWDRECVETFKIVRYRIYRHRSPTHSAYRSRRYFHPWVKTVGSRTQSRPEHWKYNTCNYCKKTFYWCSLLCVRIWRWLYTKWDSAAAAAAAARGFDSGRGINRATTLGKL